METEEDPAVETEEDPAAEKEAVGVKAFAVDAVADEAQIFRSTVCSGGTNGSLRRVGSISSLPASLTSHLVPDSQETE